MLVNGFCYTVYEYLNISLVLTILLFLVTSSLVTDTPIIFTIEKSQDLDDLGVTSFGKLPLEPAFGDHVVWKARFLCTVRNCKLGTGARVWRWVGAPNLQGTAGSAGCYEQAQKLTDVLPEQI